MRKRSGKPGASHLIAIQNAHGKGDFKTAKRAALDYAKACHQHGNAEEEAEYHATAPSQPMSMGKASGGTDRRAQLAKIAASRKKPS